MFIAHASPDAALAERLYDELAAHCRVFLDSRSLRPGDDWDVEIPRAQYRSRISVVLVTPRSNSAYYMREEIAAAINLARSGDHRVIPLFLDGAAPTGPDVHYGLRLKHSLTISGAGLAGAARRILDLLAELNGQAPTSPPAPQRAPARAHALRVVFERKPEYPTLNFSIANTTDRQVQVSAIRITEAASVRDEHDTDVYRSVAQRETIGFSIGHGPVGSSVRVFGDDSVAIIAPGGMDAFQLRVDAHAILSLLDMEIEYVTAEDSEPLSYHPEQVVLVHAPEGTLIVRGQRAEGEIVTFTREAGLAALVHGTPGDPVLGVCKSAGWLLWQGVATLARGNMQKAWQTLQPHLSGSPRLLTVVHALLLAAESDELRETLLAFAERCLQDPSSVIGMESAALDYPQGLLELVIQNLSRMRPGATPAAYYLKHLDNTLGRGAGSRYSSHRRQVIEALIREVGIGATEYLLQLVNGDPDLLTDMSNRLIKLVGKSGEISRAFEHDLAEIFALSCHPRSAEADERLRAAWRAWWAENSGDSRFRGLDWRPHSPRLLQVLGESNAA